RSSGWIAVGEDGSEAVADLADFLGHSIALNAEVKVPIEVPVGFQVGSHQRFAGILAVEQFGKKLGHLFAVHGTVEIGRDRAHVDALAAIVGSALLQRLQEYGNALLRVRAPSLAQHTP